ncbi:hypothetical protein AAK706_02405 [Erysipelotrichaceae bacterium 66-17]|uniref:MurR/RpiR family transcriptional regulator n=1 Tax=uncultured Dubosiella sp. TaxID=1937011 RepID=UPI0026296AB9|nr:hypothetical protein [uncultured Dubosiella sp.]
MFFSKKKENTHSRNAGKKDDFSSSERIVAHTILESSSMLHHLSIRALAVRSYVSTTVIVHLLHKLGFESYNEFKERFLEEIRYLNSHFEEVDANVPFSKEDNAARVCESIGELYRETVEDTLSLIDHIDYLKAVRIMEQSRTIHVLCCFVFGNDPQDLRIY